MFADAAPPRNERIAVIGAGPAGLTYASLVAEGNAVTVFEKDARPGGAFRYAGKAPMFQEVEANPRELRALHRRHGGGLRAQGRELPLRQPTSRATPELLAPFDRIVVATGAAYPLRARPVGDGDARLGRRPLAAALAVVVGAGIARLVLLPGPPRNRRPLSAAGQARPDGHRRSATRRRPARASRRSPARSTRRCCDRRSRCALASAAGDCAYLGQPACRQGPCQP